MDNNTKEIRKADEGRERERTQPSERLLKYNGFNQQNRVAQQYLQTIHATSLSHAQFVCLHYILATINKILPTKHIQT